MELEQRVMKYIQNIAYNLGKFLLAIILFVAMILSTVILLPFVIGGKIMDFWLSYQMESTRGF